MGTPSFSPAGPFQISAEFPSAAVIQMLRHAPKISAPKGRHGLHIPQCDGPSRSNDQTVILRRNYALLDRHLVIWFIKFGPNDITLKNRYLAAVEMYFLPK